jgi:hypothetical protein
MYSASKYHVSDYHYIELSLNLKFASSILNIKPGQAPDHENNNVNLND